MLKRAAMLFAGILTAFCLLFSLVGCTFHEGAGGDQSQTAEDSEAMRMYKEAVDAGYGGSYLDFLTEFGTWLEEKPANGTDNTDTNGSGTTDGTNGTNGTDGSDTPSDPNATGTGSTTPPGGSSSTEESPSAGSGANLAALSVVRVQSNFRTNYYGQTYETASSGAGVIYSLDREAGDAYILTNYHVIYAASSIGNETIAHVSDNISVWLYGGEDDDGKLTATFVGGAVDYDLAVLHIEGDDKVIVGTSSHTNASVLQRSAARAITPHDSEDLSVGDGVFVIGYPNGEGISVSSGVLSVKAEYITTYAINNPSRTVDFLVMRTDAAVNHGNSGGGMFNAKGEYIGTVNARSEEDGVVLFGYAIPSALSIPVADNVIAAHAADSDVHGALRADLGFSTRASMSNSTYDETTGKSGIMERVAVSRVPASGAASGSLRVGDILLTATLNGVTMPIEREYQLTFLRFLLRAGDTVTYDVMRGSVKTTVSVVYEEKHFTVI